MYVLDSDSLSHFFRDQCRTSRLSQRILSTPPRDLYITIITVEEQFRGALDVVHRNRNSPKAVQSYDFLLRVGELLRLFQVLPYDQRAHDLFQAFPPEARRAGTQDCRIAAIAVSLGYTVITRNTRDFVRIPGALVQDWTL